MDDDQSSDIKDAQNTSMSHLLQLQALYSTTTAITLRCFAACFDPDGKYKAGKDASGFVRRLGSRLGEGDKQCMQTCAANIMRSRMLISRRLMEAVRQHEL